MIYDELGGVDPRQIVVDAKDPTRRKLMPATVAARDLLTPVIRGGRVICESEPLEVIRARARGELQRLHPTIRRFMNPHEFPVGLDIGLHERRDAMIQAARDPQAAATPEG